VSIHDINKNETQSFTGIINIKEVENYIKEISKSLDDNKKIQEYILIKDNEKIKNLVNSANQLLSVNNIKLEINTSADIFVRFNNNYLQVFKNTIRLLEENNTHDIKKFKNNLSTLLQITRVDNINKQILDDIMSAFEIRITYIKEDYPNYKILIINNQPYMVYNSKIYEIEKSQDNLVKSIGRELEIIQLMISTAKLLTDDVNEFVHLIKNTTTKSITCKDCNSIFKIKYKELVFYNKKNFVLPKRCKSCRNNRKIK